jgi:RND family efflux transporter MFP subunit
LALEKPNLDQLRIERPPEASPKPWGKFLLLVIILVVLAAAAVFWFKPVSTVMVRTATAKGVTGEETATVLNASGYVTARRQATVSSKFTGKVTEVLIEEGMLVEEGQVLARLDDSNIHASLRLSEAQVLSSERGLAETSALLKEAQLNYDRTTSLVDKGLASESERDRSRALAESLKAQLERKRADVEVSSRQADIYLQQIEDTVIRAPFAGVIVAKNAQPGEMISPVSAGGGFTRTGIGTIVDMSSLEIEIDVNEAYINRVTPGQGVVATLDAYPDWKIPFHVIAIIPTADRQRATVEVRVGFDQLDPRILPDMGVKVAFQEADGESGGDTNTRGVLVPVSAIGDDGDRDYLFVVVEGRAERRAVATGEVRGSEMLVVSGLSTGEKVVVEIPQDLTDGDAVEEKRR